MIYLLKGNVKKSTSILVVFMIFLAMFTVSGCSSSNTLVLSGTVESTQIDINSETAGKVISIEKEEGSIVKKGEVVAILDSSLQELTVKQQEALVKLKQAKLDDVKAGSRSEQLQQAEAAVKAARAKLDELKTGTRPEQVRQAKALVDAAKVSVETAEITYAYWLDKYENVKSLYDENKISENDLKDAKYKADTAKQQVLAAREQLKSTQAQYDLLKNGASSYSIEAAESAYEQAAAQLNLLKQGATTQTISTAEADLEQTLAALEQAKLVLSKYRLKSPIDGTLLSTGVNIGDMVNTGSNTGTVSDLTNIWMRVYIPQKYLNSVKLGQQVQLTTTFLKDANIKGEITFISSKAEFTPKNVETSEAKENTVFRIKVKILDHVDQLKPGMTVDAHIPLNN